MPKEAASVPDVATKALRVLMLVAIQDMKLKDQVSLLSRAGFDRNEIASLVGTTPNSVSVRLAELKTEAKRAATRVKGR